MRARGGEAAQVEGLPESALALASQTARAKGDEASTTEGGPWVITLDAPAYMPVMQYAKDRSLREKIYRFTSASRARANLLRAYLCRSIGANWHSRSKSPSSLALTDSPAPHTPLSLTRMQEPSRSDAS